MSDHGCLSLCCGVVVSKLVSLLLVCIFFSGAVKARRKKRPAAGTRAMLSFATEEEEAEDVDPFA